MVDWAGKDIVLEFPAIIDPSSNWVGYLNCSHGTYEYAKPTLSVGDQPGLISHILASHASHDTWRDSGTCWGHARKLIL